MSFGANAIGFFLDIDASKMRSELASAEKSYVSFIEKIDKLNQKAITTVEKGLADIVSGAKKVAGATASAHKSVNDSSIRELSKMLTQALSNVQVRMTAAKPLRKSPLFDQSNSLVANFKKMAQPPDFIGGFKMQKFERGGRVNRQPGVHRSAAFGDNVTIRANEGEQISTKETFEDIVEELHALRGGLKGGDTSKIRELLTKQTALMESLTRARQASYMGEKAARYDRVGVGVANAGVIHGSLQSARGGLRSAIAGMDPSTFEELSGILERMDAQFGSMEHHLERMAKSTSSVKKDVKAVAGGDPSTRYLATSQMIRDLSGNAQNFLGSTPHTQEAFAKSYAQLGGSFQQGRRLFSGAYSQVGTLADEQQIAAGSYYATQAGFRGRSAMTVAASTALANQGVGFGQDVSTGLFSGLRRAGFSSRTGQVSLANIVNQIGAVGANGALTSQIIGGADIGGMIATRGGGNAGNVTSGLGGLAARMLRGAGNNERGAGAAQQFMSMISDYGKSGVMASGQLVGLAGAFGVDQGVLDRLLATGDQKEFISSASGFAKNMLNQDVSTRAAHAQIAGMDPAAYTDALRALADLPTAGLNDAIRNATQAINSLSGAASNATNAASHMSNAFSNFGSQAGSALGGAYSAVTDAPWLQALGGYHLGKDVLGGARRMMGGRFGNAAGRIGGAVRGGLGRIGAGAAAYGQGMFGGARAMMPAPGMYKGVPIRKAITSKSLMMRQGASKHAAQLARARGIVPGAKGAGWGGRAGSAAKWGMRAGGRVLGGLLSAPVQVAIGVPMLGYAQIMAGKERYEELTSQFAVSRTAEANSLRDQFAKATDPAERARLEREFNTVRGYAEGHQNSLASDTWDKVKDGMGFKDGQIDEIEAAASGSSRRGLASQILGLAMMDKDNIKGIKDLAPLKKELANIKSSTMEGAIGELSAESQALVNAGAMAKSVADDDKLSQSDDDDTRGKFTNTLLTDIRDTLRRIAGGGRAMAANVGEDF